MRALVRADRSLREWEHYGSRGRRTAVERRKRRLTDAVGQVYFFFEGLAATSALEDWYAELFARLDDRRLVDLLHTLPEAPLARPGLEHVRALRRVLAARVPWKEEPELEWKLQLRRDPGGFFAWLSSAVRLEADREWAGLPRRPEAAGALLEDPPLHGQLEGFSENGVTNGATKAVDTWASNWPRKRRRARRPSPLEQFAADARATRKRFSNLAKERGIKPQRLYDALRRANAKSERFRRDVTAV
jgi:hypothetical protein